MDSNLELNGFSELSSLSFSLAVSQQQGGFHSERPQFRAAAACQDVVQGWQGVGDLVLGDGLEKIPLMNRRPGLYAGQVSTKDRRGRGWRAHRCCSTWLYMTFETQCNLQLWNHSTPHPVISQFFVTTTPNPAFKRDAQLCLSPLLSAGRKDQSLGKVSSVNSHRIDPHAAKFGGVWIIHAGRTCPRGPETVLVHYTSCVAHTVIQQHSCLASAHWSDKQPIRRGHGSDRESLVWVPPGAHLVANVSFSTTACRNHCSKHCTLSLYNAVNDPALCIFCFLSFLYSTEMHVKSIVYCPLIF